MKKILAIGSHVDDIELGCAGTLLKHVDNGDKIKIIIVTNSEYDDHNGHRRLASETRKEGIKSAKLIGAEIEFLNFKALDLMPNKNLIFKLSNALNKFNPDIIYTHFIHDIHLDHVAVAKASLIAAKHVKTLIMYKSNLYTSVDDFNPNLFIDIGMYIKQKEEILKIFKSESSKIKRWTKELFVLGEYYGTLIECNYAEAFKIVKYNG